MSKILWASRISGGAFLRAASSGASALMNTMEAVNGPPPYKVSGPALVSIIVPTLQEEGWLEPLLISAENQTYEPLEVIIVDSSPPESKQVTQELANLHGARMVSCPKLGISVARNAGAEAVSGDVLVFADADCIMAHDFVERLMYVLAEGAVLAHGNDCVFDDRLNNAIHSFWRWMKPTWYTTGRGVAIRAEDFFAIGGYDESCDPMAGCREDLDLGRRVSEHFGPGAVSLDRRALVATSSRRPIGEPGVWQHRGYRGEGVVIDTRATMSKGVRLC